MKNKKKNILWLLLIISISVSGQKNDSTPAKSSLLKRTSFHPIPIISYNRSVGFVFGLTVTSFTAISKNDTISPPTMTRIGGGYTTNNSWFGFANQSIFLKEDKIRINWNLGLGNLNFQYFQETGESGNGSFVNFNTVRGFGNISVMYNIFNRFYAGLRYQYSQSNTKFEADNVPNQKTNLSGFGIPVSFDSRDFVINPSKGWLINGTYIHNTAWLGSDFEFKFFVFNANNYRKINPKGILASRFFSYTGIGEVPFVGQRAIGQIDIRGYTNGKHRSNIVMNIQSEYRYNIYKKWGCVAFAGLATAFESDGIAGSGMLPGAGVGVRYMAIPKRRMNAGIDAAIGKNDWGIYFRIGEAF
jgi:outer membrane protein assembly factor BamA